MFSSYSLFSISAAKVNTDLAYPVLPPALIQFHHSSVEQRGARGLQLESPGEVLHRVGPWSRL